MLVTAIVMPVMSYQTFGSVYAVSIVTERLSLCIDVLDSIDHVLRSQVPAEFEH